MTARFVSRSILARLDPWESAGETLRHIGSGGLLVWSGFTIQLGAKPMYPPKVSVF
jgi:hypothetical protein